MDSSLSNEMLCVALWSNFIDTQDIIITSNYYCHVALTIVPGVMLCT